MNRIALTASLATCVIFGIASSAPGATNNAPVLFWFAGLVMDGPDRVEMVKKYGLPDRAAGDIIVDSRSIRELVESKSDILDYYKKSGAPLWYHNDEKLPPSILVPIKMPMSQEPAAGPGGVSLVDGLKWDECAQKVYERFTHWIGEDGASDLSKPGGIVGVKEAFGKRPTHLGSNRIWAAPNGWAFNMIVGLPLVEMGVGKAHGLNRFPPDVVERYTNLGGNSDFFWYMGVVNNNPNQFVSTRDRDALERLKNMISQCDRTRVSMVMIDVQIRQSDADKTNYDKFIEYLSKEFIPANPGSRFISNLDIMDLVVPEKGKTIDSASLTAAANQLVSDWKGRPPKFVQLKSDCFSLGDMFQALAAALAGSQKKDRLPESVATTELYGPICDMEELPSREKLEGKISVADVLATAAKVYNEIVTAPATQFVPKPPNRIPALVACPGGQTLNAAEFLLVMAKEYLEISRNQKPVDIPLESANILSPAADVLDEVFAPKSPYPIWYSKLQMWTLKPVRWKTL